MSVKRNLPFGRTSVKLEEIKKAIDLDTAASILQEKRVRDARERIRGFVERIPAALSWLEENGRVYPWRMTTDPWKVYVAEILLQRTRADAVAEVYPDFVERFPGPESLRDAPDSEIEELVKELGLVNRRLKGLRDVADIFAGKHGGNVPDSIAELKEPWRIGDYCARACQLFARGRPLALVDANVARVMGRILGYELPAQPHKSEKLHTLIGALVPDDSNLARSFNLAILDLGALVCTPSNPECDSCPIRGACVYCGKHTEKK